MTTQVIFKIDKKLKERAMRKARAEGVPFSAVLKLATKAFVDDRLQLDVAVHPPFNEKTHKLILKALDDIKKGKNLSPTFSNVEDAIRYLEEA